MVDREPGEGSEHDEMAPMEVPRDTPALRVRLIEEIPKSRREACQVKEMRRMIPGSPGSSSKVELEERAQCPGVS